MLPSSINYRKKINKSNADLLSYEKGLMLMHNFCGKHCRGKPGCWGTASPNSLIKEFTPPVCGALGVIGNSGSAYHNKIIRNRE